MIISYRQAHDDSISDELKRRFSEEVEALEHEGFRFLSLQQEINWPFSVILFFPVYVLMATKEYVRVEPPLRITSYHLMYVSEDRATLAYVYGLGPKFYTRFIDGTWLVSNTAQSSRDEKVIVQKRDDEVRATDQIWKMHHGRVQEYRAKGLQLAAQVSFEDWMELEGRFDRSNVIPGLGLGVVWLAFLAWVVYCVVMLGRVLAALIL
jgi:hypothetical protein